MISPSEKIRNTFEKKKNCYFMEDDGSHVELQHAKHRLEMNDDDVCEQLLDSKMNALELNDGAHDAQRRQLNATNLFDGSDSGVDIAITAITTANHNNVTLQRALSNNSGGYASSSTCGGLDDCVLSGFNGGGNVSCNSSVLSYSSDMCEARATTATTTTGVSPATIALTPRTPSNSYECCSENGSESSSVAGGGGFVTPLASGQRRAFNSVKKKVALFEPQTVTATNGSKSSRGKDTYNSPTASTPTTAASTPMAQFSNGRTRPRLSGITRTASLTRQNANAAACKLQARERARSREKSTANHQPSTTGKEKKSSTATASVRTTPIRPNKPHKPDSFPTPFAVTTTTTAITTSTPSMQRILQRTPSLSRARTPGTPSDDGRWPSNSSRSVRGLSATPDAASVKKRTSVLATSAANPYSTLPRRRKQKSVEDLSANRSNSRSSSNSRDALSNARMVSSVVLSTRRSGNAAKMPPPPTPPKAVAAAAHSSGSLSRTPSLARSIKHTLPKTRIYHETSAQTAITSEDLEKVFAGAMPLTLPSIDAVDCRHAQTQSDIRDRELERLQQEVEKLRQHESELMTKLSERTQKTAQLEVQLKNERAEKLSMQRELHLNTERVMGMLDLTRVAATSNNSNDDDSGGDGNDDAQCDSLLMLESQIQLSGYELHEKQQECRKLRQLCRTLQAEMARSLQMQESLMQEKAAIEQESSELHDFLQHEKAAMCDALRDLEQEYTDCKQLLTVKDEEIKVLRDECRHLVRLNEQRRQENRMLQSKYVALEHKSKEMIAQQNNSVCTASQSLSGLHSRLHSLVGQLVTSYNISEQDLEDKVFHNDVAGNGSTHLSDGLFGENTHPSNVEASNCGSSDGSLSPQRNQSFLAAVISAIRNATTPSSKKLLSRSKKQNQPQHQQQQQTSATRATSNGEESEDSITEMLDSETEPCLMMDNALEDAMTAPKESASELMNSVDDTSLQNLSQAITNRQQMELRMNSLAGHKLPLNLNHLEDLNSVSEDGAISCHDSISEMPSLLEYCSPQTVVDQVMEVDSIITKLLKVLRLIQMDNDSCIQQLIVDKNKLQQNKEDMLEKLKVVQDANTKLQDDLMDATQELMLKNNDVSNSKTEIQRHRNEIDVRF